jgi:hypothetical protein
MHHTASKFKISHHFGYTLYIVTAIESDFFGSRHKCFIYNLFIIYFSEVSW